MRPKPFVPVCLCGDERFVCDQQTDQIYHRVYHRVLYADTDRSGFVYHANYLRYFELGRAGLMREVGFPYSKVEDSGFVYPIVDLGVTYFQPLVYDNPMWICTRPAELQRVRIRFEYVIVDADTTDMVCKGFTTHCALNQNKKPVGVDPITVKTFQTFPRAVTKPNQSGADSDF